MTDLISRLHAQAEKRGIEIDVAYPIGDGEVRYARRHPLEIAHEVLARLPQCVQPLRCNGDTYIWEVEPDWYSQPTTFIECVVALAERETL